MINKGSFIHNLSFVFGAQVIVLLISVLRALILPKFLPVDGFGYWELYLFYTAYVGIFCFGYNDGIYLNYGECDVEQLPMKELRSANRLFCVFLSIVTIIVLIVLFSIFHDLQSRFSLCFAAGNVFILGITSVCIYIFQITGQFKNYSFFSIIDKILVILAIFILIIVNEANFKYVVIVDFVSKIGALVWMISKMPELFLGNTTSYSQSYKFMIDNMSVGIKLLIANLMSMLLVGAGKFIVQIFGDINDFAIYSFGVSITGLVLTAVTAVSLVLYPTIKRIPSEDYSKLFNRVNVYTRVLGLMSLLLYYPIYIFIEYFYPKYDSVLTYLAALSVIVYLQCKISLLNNTFYKVLRLETKMFIANMSCVFIFVVMALIIFPSYRDISVIALCTCMAMMIRCYSSEITLSRYVGIKPDNRIVLELFVIILFLISTWFLSLLLSAAIFIFTMVVWLINDKKENGKIVELFLKPSKA